MILILTAILLASCSSESDPTAKATADDPNAVAVAAFNAAEPGWRKIIAAFTASPDGRGVSIAASYGSSGEQTQAILDGKPVDLVHFTDAMNIDRLVQAGKVSLDWNRDPGAASPVGSVVTFVVRQGNPRKIRGWADLLQSGLEVVCPNPVSLGSGKWSLLAAYAFGSNGNQDRSAGLTFVRTLVYEHVKPTFATGAAARDSFVNGTGDVLITSEANAIALKRQGEPVELVMPAQTMKIDDQIALVRTGAHQDLAKKLMRYTSSPDGQRLWAQSGFRPADPTVAAEFSADFPTPQTLWTIDALGGWHDAGPRFFDSQKGAITKIFRDAVG